jgi:hypothetical protein
MALTAAFLSTPHAVRAQSQGWVLTFLISPRPSPFLADYERNPALATLTALYTGTAPRTFRIEVFVRGSTVGEIVRVISPQQSLPAGPVSQAYTATDMADWHTESSNAAVLNLIKRAGVLPEGQYQVCARVLDLSGVQQAQGCASFSIVLPEPPRLIAPANLTRLVSAQPMFQWTPVIAPPELGLTYQVRVVQLDPQQTPQSALVSNRPYYNGTVAGAPILVYPVDALPMRDDHDYVWQVTALDATGRPIASRNGQSEMWTFHPGEIASLPGETLPDQLDLIPGVARLRGLSATSVTSSPISFTVNGAVTLDLLAPVQTSIRVTATDLAIDRSALPTASVRSGQLAGSASGVTSGLGGLKMLTVNDIAYTPASGLTMGASLALNGSSPVPLTGRLTVTALGLYGQLSTQSSSGATLGAFGQNPVRLLVNRASVSLPAGDVELDGPLELFGQALGCTQVSVTATAGSVQPASVSCATRTPVPVVAEVSSANLVIGGVSGTLSVDLGAGTLTPALTASADLTVGASSSVSCGAVVDLTIAAQSVTSANPRPHCTGSGTGHFGWLQVGMSNAALQRLTYQAGRGFDFGLTVDLSATVNALGLTLPTISGAVVAPNGLTLPATDGAVSSASTSLAPLAMHITHVRSSAVTIPWSEWQAGSAQHFSFGMDATLSLASLAGQSPACLAGASVATTGATLSGGVISAPLASTDLEQPCVIPLSAGAAFELDGIGGSLSAQIANGAVTATALPNVRGAFLLSNYFVCGSSAPSQQRVALATPLSIGPHGGLVGSVTNVSPGCPLNLSAVQLSMTGGTLTFSEGSAGEQVVLDASATASFGATSASVQGSGHAAVDLLAGTWLSGSLSFSGPFRLDLPRQAPALSFTVPGATLDANGLGIDGRATLMLPGGSSVNATFAHAELNPQTLVMSSGQVLFDAGFGLEADIASTGLAWHAVAAGSALGSTDAMRVDLPTNVSLGVGGLSAAGNGGGALVYQGKAQGTLAGTLSSDFALALSPFGVTAGRADLASGASAVAYVDRTGFHPELGTTAQGVVPAQVGLPTIGVAYITLKDAGGNALVQSATVAAGLHVYTAPGQTVTLSVPALALGGGAAPQMAVALDVVINPAQATIVSGFVRASVPSGAAGFDLSGGGLPFVIDTIAYDQGASSGSGAAYQLTVGGSVSLFGQKFSATPRAAMLTIDGGGQLTGSVSAKPALRIPLSVGATGFGLIVNGITGAVSTPLLGGARSWQLSIDATLDLDFGGGQKWDAGATILAGTAGLTVQSVNGSGSGAPGVTLNPGILQLALSNLRVSQLAYAAATGFNVALMVDVGLSVPVLGGLTLPPIQGVTLSTTGLAVPAVSVPEITSSMFPQGSSGVFTTGGFSLTPLAFRMDAAQYNWGSTSAPPWNLGVDLQVALSALDQSAPQALRDLKVTVLNAGIQNGQLSGTIQPRNLATPIVLDAFQISGLSGSIAVPVGAAGVGAPASGTSANNAVTVGVTGSAVLPAFLRCAASSGGVAPATNDVLTLGSNGSLTGAVKGLVPQCPATFGPLTFTITSSELDFSAGTSAATAMLLQSTGTLSIAGATAGQTATATGSIGIDLIAAKVVSGSISLTQPFRWSPLAGGGFPSFTLSSAVLDATGFRMSGPGALALDGGGSVSAGFENLTLSLPQLAITAGSVTISNGFTLGVGLGTGGGVTWSAKAPGAVIGSGVTAGATLTAPQTITLDQHGLAFNGSASGSLVFGGQTFASLGAAFGNAFTIGLSALSVKQGRASFLSTSGDTVAYIDSLGFTPGNLFALAQLPDRLGLPTTDVAYLQLGGSNVKMTPVGNNYELTGTGVQLVIPALAAGGTPPTISITLDLTVNKALAPQSGSVTATAAAGATLFSLKNLGVPLDVTGLSFAARSGGGYTFRIDDAKLSLAALGAPNTTLDFSGVTVSSAGLSGTLSVGNVGPHYQAPTGAPPFPAMTISNTDAVSVQLTGVKVTLGAQPSVAIGALVQSDLFTPPAGSASSATPGIYLTGTVAVGGGVSLTADASSAGALSLGPATFTPQSIAAAVSSGNFAVTLNGTLAVPPLGSGVSFNVPGLTIGTAGVVLPPHVSLSSTNAQGLQLWGLPVTLQDSVLNGATVGNYYALQLSRNASTKVITVEASGYLNFLGADRRFVGLQVRTDGHLHLAYASLVPDPLTIVANTLTLKSLNIVSDALQPVLDITLPAPMPTAVQEVSFSIAPGGGVSGGGALSLFDDAGDLSAAKAAVPLGPLGTVMLRHVGLSLNSASIANSEIDANADFYFQNDANSVVNLGYQDGVGEHAGLRITFGGNTSFGNVRVPNAFNFDFGPGQLAIGTTGVSLPAATTGFALGLSGDLSLHFTAVSGSLGLSGLIVKSTGDLDFAPAHFTSGSLSVAGVASVELDNIAFNGTPGTQIKVPSVVLPSGSSTSAAPASDNAITVQSYLTFGGKLSLGPSSASIISGAVDSLIFYKTTSGVGFGVKQMTISVAGVLDGSGSMAFATTPTGFTMFLGATAKLLGISQLGSASVIGAFEQDATVTRMGMFIAVGGLQFPITPTTPAATLTGLGGGFFLNPRQEWLDYVALGAQVQTSGTTVTVTDQASFAVLLYAAAALGPPGTPFPIATGQVLLTVTDAYLRLQGKFVVLGQTDQLVGTGDLYASWHRGAIEGNITLNASYAGLLTGHGNLSFFVYANPGGPQDPIWGITGTLTAKVVGLLNADANFFAGPPGFMLDISISSGGLPAIAFVSLDSVGAQVWWIQSGGFGAVVAVKGSVNVIPDVLTVSTILKGALLDGNPSFLYAEATLDVNATVASWKGTVWASLNNGVLDGGTGGNAADEAAIAEAEAAAQQIAQAKNAAQGALTQAQQQIPGAASLSTTDLLTAYQAVSTLAATNPTKVLNFFGGEQLGDPACQAPKVPDFGTTYQRWYYYLALETGAPPKPAQVTSYANSVASGIAAVSAQQPAVSARIAAIQTTIGQGTQAAQGGPLPPVLSQVSFGAPVTTSRVVGKDTIVQVQAGTGPGFHVDATASLAAKQQLQQSSASHAQSAQNLRQRIAAVEQVLTTVRAATTDGSSGSLLSFAKLNAQVVSNAEAEFATQEDYLYSRYDWLGGALQALGTQSLQWIHDRTECEAKQAAAIIPVLSIPQVTRASLFHYFNGLWTLAQGRLQRLIDLSGDPAPLNTFLQNATQVQHDWTSGILTTDSAIAFFANQADTSGKQLWFNLEQVGLTASQVQTQNAAKDLQNAAASKLATVRGTHGALTSSLKQLYDGQAALTSALYDAYDRYVLAYGAPAGSTPTTKTAATAVVPQYTTRRAQLASDLTVPTLTSALVQATVHGYYVALGLSWSGTHPDGTYEYLVDASDTESLTGNYQWMSAGPGGSASGYRFVAAHQAGQTDPALRFDHGIAFGVRGGAGYMGLANSAPLTVNFQRPTFSYSYDTSLPVGQGSPLPPASGPVTMTTTVGAAADNTAPAAPQVTFATAAVGPSGVAWVADSTSIGVSWSATDAQSGIAQYQYRVRPGAQPTTLAPLPGSATRAAPPAIPFASVGGRPGTTLLHTGLTPAAGIYVDVQAQNGGGVWSASGTSPLLRLDVTPPAWPPGAAIKAGQVTASTGGTATQSSLPAAVGTQPRAATGAGTAITTQVASLPPTTIYPACVAATAAGAGATATGGPTAQMTAGAQAVVGGQATWQFASGGTGLPSTATPPVLPPSPAPAFDVTRPDAVDAESGIQGYYWHADTLPGARFLDGSGWTTASALIASATSPYIHFTGAPLDYVHPLYFSVVPVNYAGLVGEPLQFGPVTIVDPSAPNPPALCANLVAGGSAAQATIAVTMQTPAVDPQSGVAGYVYRVRKVSTSATAVNNTILRAFPASGYDWTGALGGKAGTTLLAGPIAAQEGDTLYLDVSAANTQGLTSVPVGTGPIVIDHSPPPQPTGVSGSYSVPSAGTWTISFIANIPNDPQSGISRLEVAIGTSPTGTEALGWTPVTPAHAGVALFALANQSGAALAGGTYYLQVRSVNGVGLAGPFASFKLAVPTSTSAITGGSQ